MWTLWAATEAETHTLEVMMNRVGKAPAARDAARADAAVRALRGPFRVLDEALESGFLVGGRFTVADLNTAEVIRYAMPAPELFEGAPRVKTWLSACQSRPAFKRMWEAREKEPA
jgi:glutathione S-transferase